MCTGQEIPPGRRFRDSNLVHPNIYAQSCSTWCMYVWGLLLGSSSMGVVVVVALLQVPARATNVGWQSMGASCRCCCSTLVPVYPAVVCPSTRCFNHVYFCNDNFLALAHLKLPLQVHGGMPEWGCRSREARSRTKSSSPPCPFGFSFCNGVKQKRNHRSGHPRREWAAALQGAGAEGQHRATPTRAAAPEAPPVTTGSCPWDLSLIHI